MSGCYRVAAHVGQVEEQAEFDSAVIHVAALPDGPILVLEGSAAIIWRYASLGGSAQQIAEQVGLDYGVPPSDVLADVRAFLDGLVARGLLFRSHEHEAPNAHV